LLGQDQHWAACCDISILHHTAEDTAALQKIL